MSDTSSVSSVPAPDQTFLSHLTLADLMGDSVLQDLLHSIYSISGLRISLTTCQGDRILALHEYMTPFCIPDLYSAFQWQKETFEPARQDAPLSDRSGGRQGKRRPTKLRQQNILSRLVCCRGCGSQHDFCQYGSSSGFQKYFCQRLDLTAAQVYVTASPMKMGYVFSLADKLSPALREELTDPPFTPQFPAAAAIILTTTAKIFLPSLGILLM